MTEAKEKAYRLTCDYLDEGNDEIVHAENRSKARMKGDMLNDVDRFIDIKVRRAPEFDNKPLTDKTYIENGWYVERFGEFVSKDWAHDHNVILAFDENGELLNPFPDGEPTCQSCDGKECRTEDQEKWCHEHNLCWWALTDLSLSRSKTEKPEDVQ